MVSLKTSGWELLQWDVGLTINLMLNQPCRALQEHCRYSKEMVITTQSIHLMTDPRDVSNSDEWTVLLTVYTDRFLLSSILRLQQVIVT